MASKKMQLVRSAVAGLRAQSDDKEKQSSLDAIVEALREVASDENESEDDRASAVRMLKSVGAPVAGDDKDADKGKAKAMGPEARYISARMGGGVEATGVRHVGTALELGHMTPAQAEARLRAIQGHGGR